MNIGGFSFRPEMRPSDMSLCSMLSSSSFSVDFIRSATTSFPGELFAWLALSFSFPLCRVGFGEGAPSGGTRSPLGLSQSTSVREGRFVCSFLFVPPPLLLSIELTEW